MNWLNIDYCFFFWRQATRQSYCRRLNKHIIHRRNIKISRVKTVSFFNYLFTVWSKVIAWMGLYHLPRQTLSLNIDIRTRACLKVIDFWLRLLFVNEWFYICCCRDVFDEDYINVGTDGLTLIFRDLFNSFIFPSEIYSFIMIIFMVIHFYNFLYTLLIY